MKLMMNKCYSLVFKFKQSRMILIRKFSFNFKDNLTDIFNLINEAYKIELGEDGVAFKKFDRVMSIDELRVDELHIATSEDNTDTAVVVGAVIIHVRDEDGVAEIGPLAVSPSYQGQGIGSLLLKYAEDRHKVTEIGLVSCRTDLEGFYSKRGYR